MKKISIALMVLAVLLAFASCDNSTPAPNASSLVTLKWRANMMGDEDLATTQPGNIASDKAMKVGSYITTDGSVIGTFYRVDNASFTAYAAGMTGDGYYANYEFTGLPNLSENKQYLAYLIKEADGTEYYGTSQSRAKCTKLGDSVSEASKYEITYYLVDLGEGTFTQTAKTELTDENRDTFEAMIAEADELITLTFSEANFDTVNEPVVAPAPAAE